MQRTHWAGNALWWSMTLMMAQREQTHSQGRLSALTEQSRGGEKTVNVLLFPNKSILKVSAILETNKHADKSLHLHSGDLFVTENSFRATMQQNALWFLVVRCELKFVLHVGTTFCIFSIFDTHSRHSKMLSDKRSKKYVHTGLSMKWWAPNRLKKSVSVHYYILRTNSTN